MLQIGAVSILEESERIDESPHFAGKVVIQLSFCPCPETTWSGDQRMIDWCRRNIATLLELGLITDEVIERTKTSGKHAAIAIEFPDFEVAEKVFWRLPKAGIVDIYLYDHGVIRAKYD